MVHLQRVAFLFDLSHYSEASYTYVYIIIMKYVMTPNFLRSA